MKVENSSDEDHDVEIVTEGTPLRETSPRASRGSRTSRTSAVSQSSSPYRNPRESRSSQPSRLSQSHAGGPSAHHGGSSVQIQEPFHGRPVRQSLDVRKTSSWDGRGGSLDRATSEMPRRSKHYSVDIPREGEHTIPVRQLAQMKKESNIDPKEPEQSKGLNIDEAASRLETDGRNELTPPPEEPVYVTFFKQFKNPFLILLLLAAGLAFLGYGLLDAPEGGYDNLVLAVALISIVFITGFISFKQERETLAVIDSFKNMLPSQCVVMRNGERTQIGAAELVVGDIVLLVSGDRVPADLRILKATDLKVECSALTGESEPVELTPEEEQEEIVQIEARCLAFNGSLVLEGNGVGLVIATGDRTVVGRIASLTGNTGQKQSNMEREITRFVYFIAILAISMAVIFFTIGVARRQGDGWLEMFITGFLLVIVANVPQGLPASVTSLLTLTAKRMAKHRVLVKQLDSVEALGATSVICSDKTGTLTKNEMEVVDAWVGCNLGTRAFEDIPLEGKEKASGPTASAQIMSYVGAVCNTATCEGGGELGVGKDEEEGLGEARTPPEEKEDDEESPEVLELGQKELKDPGVVYAGSPTEQALIKFCDKNITPHSRLRALLPKIYEIPFSSKTKWHCMVVDATDASQSLAPLAEGAHVDLGSDDLRATFLKGAPEKVMNFCSTYMRDGKVLPIDDEFKTTYDDVYRKFGSRGQRVIGTAAGLFNAHKIGEIKAKEDVPMKDLCFLGVYAIMDPPRDDVPGAVADCRQAGIRVFMVTGDHPLTARAIAEKVGILDKEMTVAVLGSDEDEHKNVSVPKEESDAFVIEGWVIENFDDEMWDRVLEKEAIVFARTTPENKLTIVTQCQNRREVVAVTGDGVNDGPALKKANIGVAMGMCGSEVAKEAANIIITDDNFASIVKGVELGRLIFDNLKKTIAYTLTHLLPEILPVLLSLAFGLPQGLSSLQILTIDLLTEMAPAISLSYEVKESDIMSHKPRDIEKDRLVTPQLVSYAYLEVGIIEAAACFIAYTIGFLQYGITLGDLAFTDDKYFEDDSPPLCASAGSMKCYGRDEQIDILYRVRSTWYMTLVISQAFHIWSCKTRRVSIFKHPLFANKAMIFAVIIELLLMCIFVFIPGLNREVLRCDIPFWWSWIPGIICGLVITAFNEGRKKIIRTRPNSLPARALFW